MNIGFRYKVFNSEANILVFDIVPNSSKSIASDARLILKYFCWNEDFVLKYFLRNLTTKHNWKMRPNVKQIMYRKIKVHPPKAHLIGFP